MTGCIMEKSPFWHNSLEVGLNQKKNEYALFLQVVDMNGRWQTYNKQREQHVQRLKRQLAETSVQASSSGGEGKLSAKQQEEIDQTIMQYKRKVGIVEEEKQQVGKRF